MQGKTIDGFELRHPLGVGGMAEVWYAENSIHKTAAVKILNADLAHNEQIVERFRNEAEIMVKLSHPNIRQVYGYGNIDDRPAIIMEYLDGDDLKQRMKQGQQFTDAQLRKWWDELVDALNYTHAKGVVHRDIKPGNIFVDNNDNIKLLDFGIAKVRESISATQTGQKLGTLMYMSPEQVKDSKHIDYHTDVYSLAVTYVHLLTGKRPYDSDTSSDFEISEQIVYHPLDLSNVPAEWRGFLEPYLEKDPQKRPKLRSFVATTAQEPATDEDDATFVAEAANHHAEPVVKPQPIKESMGKTPVKSPSVKTPYSSPVERPKSKKGLWIGIGAAVVVVAAVLAVVLLRSGNDVKNSRWDDENYTSRYDNDWGEEPQEEATEASYDDFLDEAVAVDAPWDAVPGLFSVGPYKQVYFSKGNLQYQPSSDNWRFASDQWETLGQSNASVSSNYSGYIDLFGWGTGSSPIKTSTNGADYSSFYDWGNMYGGGWRTLTIDEWNYLFKSREGASYKYAAATVAYVKGIIILPDDFSTPSGCNSLITGYIDYSYNNYSYEEWNRMQEAGAVFLPTAGRRTGQQMYNYGDDGDYWSSTAYGGDKAYNVDFTKGKQLLSKDSSPRGHGFAVRLVKDY